VDPQGTDCVWIHQHVLDDGRCKPFAWSLGATLLVLGVHTGAIDAVTLTMMRAQQLGG
jgi:hypothetical protein